MNVYFISGIGADHRMFTHLRLPEGYEAIYIHWITPAPGEKLGSYALRLAQQIDTTQPFILIGLSLGGIMSVEIAKKFPPVTTILISSIPVSAHLPTYFRLAHQLRLDKFLPSSLLKTLTSIKHSLTMRGAANRKLMREIIRSGDDHFIRWAINAVLGWENTAIPPSFYHIHGSHDEIFPIGRTNPTHIIPKGGHMLVITRAATVNKALREILVGDALHGARVGDR